MNLKRFVSFMSSHLTLVNLKQANIFKIKPTKNNFAVAATAATTTKSASVVSVSINLIN